jgi:F-type H+-transporting ATPase subunit gamma
MPTLKEIKENLEMISIIKNIASTYQEIANLRMKQIREKVLKNRELFRELFNTYQRIKSDYLSSLKKGRIRKEKISFRRPKKEKVIVFSSANQFFYGALILDTWKEVQKYLEKNKADLAVVGRIGKYLAEGSGFGHKMFYFELNDVKPEEARIGKILEFIKNYKKIIVFHGRYEKVLSQKPVMNEISGKLPFEEKFEKVHPYLFEPSPEAVLEFFETEIIAALFNQTILEHQLARYASRVMAMYQATENAKNSRQKLSIVENKLKRQKLNKKQIELFGSVKL